jgi:putative transposase
MQRRDAVLRAMRGHPRTLAIWRYDYNNVRPDSSLGNLTPAEVRRPLEQSDGNAPGALVQPEANHYQTQGLSL